MNTFSKVLIACGASLCLGHFAHAEILSYHPSSTLRLGGTFDPIDLTEVKPPCVNYDNESPVDGVGETVVSPKMTFFIRQITDFREFYSYMSLSASVSGHYKLFSAGGSFHQEEENFSSSDSFSWVMGINAHYGRYRAVNPRLTDSARDLANNGDLIQFTRRCGTHAVLQISRGINAAVVFTIRNLTERNRKSVTASFNASFGGGLWGVDAGADFQQHVRSLIETGQITLDIRTIGGPGAAELASIIQDLDKANIGKVREALSRYVAKQGPDGSVPIEFQTASLSSYVPALGDPDRTNYMILIGELFVAHQENAYMLRKYRGFLQNSEDYDPTDTAISDALNAVKAIQQRLSEIQRSAIACRSVIQNTQNRRLATKVVSGRRTPVFSASEAAKVEVLIDKQYRNLIDVSRDSSIPTARDQRPAKVGLDALLDKLPSDFRTANASDLADCIMDPQWLVFSGLPQLPPFPFLHQAWSDPLSQSPDHYLHVRVSGGKVQGARLVDSTNNVLRILPPTKTPILSEE
jgi:hypothetical protein